MTRKDYVQFAIALKEGIDNAYSESDLGDDWALGYGEAVQVVVNVLKSDNPRFDEDRFIKSILK